MALPSPKFYTTGDVEITTHDFGSVEAGAYKPDSTGWKFRLWNDFGGGLSSDDMTSVKISVRDADGGTDELWTQQHWIQIKSSSGSTGVVDDAMTVFQAVGKNKELSLGDIPSDEYRTLFARCYPPTDATEQDVDFQLRVTYQQPQTSICNWITGLRGDGVVASTGDPFAMSTGGTTGTIPYEAGYALINNNEIYYGSSGSYDISTTGSGAYKIYLPESGTFNETTGSLASNQLYLYEATISSGVCTALSDKRVYLAGLQAGTTGAMPSTPDLGDLYLDIVNGVLYGAKTSTGWTEISYSTFLSLTDTPSDFTGDASKILTVTTGETAVEFMPSTGIALDSFGTPSTGTTLDATTGVHGLVPIGDADTTHYLAGDISWVSTTGVVLDSLATPTTGTALDATTGVHGLLPIGDADATHYMAGDISWVSTTGIVLDSLAIPTTGTTLDSSTGRHGLLPVLGGNTATWLDGSGAWSAPTASEVGALESSGAFTVGRLTEISTTGGVIKESPFTVTTGDVFDFGAHSAVFTEQAIATTTGTAAINWSNSIKALFTRSTGANGAVTFSFTAPPKSVNLQLTIRGSTGGSTGTVTWPAIKWDGGSAPSLGSGASDINVVSFYYSTGLTSYLGASSTGTFSS